MSKRSQAFRKNINNSKFKIKDTLKSNKIYKKDVRNNSFKELSFNEAERYNFLANLVCKILGFSEEDLKNIIKYEDLNKIDVIWLKNFVIKKKDKYQKMLSSLSEAFKAGEDKEHERHLKEEDEAFKRGVKYGREQRENEMKNASKNDLKDNFTVEKRLMTNTEINKLYDEFNKTIQKCNDILSKFWL